MEEALLAYLLADAGLSALVGTRIYWGQRPQGEAPPAIVLHLVSGPVDYVMTGPDGLVGYLVQANALGSTALESLLVRRAARAAFEALSSAPFSRAFIENQRTHPVERTEGPQASGQTEIHLNSLDVRVWHIET